MLSTTSLTLTPTIGKREDVSRRTLMLIRTSLLHLLAGPLNVLDRHLCELGSVESQPQGVGDGGQDDLPVLDGYLDQSPFAYAHSFSNVLRNVYGVLLAYPNDLLIITSPQIQDPAKYVLSQTALNFSKFLIFSELRTAGSNHLRPLLTWLKARLKQVALSPRFRSRPYGMLVTKPKRGSRPSRSTSEAFDAFKADLHALVSLLPLSR